MIRRRLHALAFALCAAAPVAAEGLDDATCGVIGEFALDLAYDAGLPAALAPDGAVGADDTGCFFTGLELSLNNHSGLRIDYLSWSGTGLEDWVAGHGLPLSLNVTLKGAYLQTRFPDLPSYEWSINVKNRRNAISGAFNARWEPSVGRLFVDRFELRDPNNAIALSGVLTGIPPEPSQANLKTLRLKALDAQIELAGAFEALVLTPFVAGLMGNQPDPEAAFAGYVALARGYIAAFPAPQIDDATKTAANGFLSNLPSPTGRLSLKINAPQQGLPTQSLQLLAIQSRATPEQIGRIVGSLMGSATLRVQWQPVTPE